MSNLKESLRLFFICVVNRGHIFENNVCKICGAVKGGGSFADIVRDLKKDKLNAGN